LRLTDVGDCRLKAIAMPHTRSRYSQNEVFQMPRAQKERNAQRNIHY
jgi:hypothetical protein